ncbi:MAG: class I SAM-dependent methyltransferase [Vitreimonas sp.]
MTSAAPQKLLYTSQPFFFTQPATLAAMAALHGVEAAPAEAARVLELGCASGGNIIPMAARFPDASFVGIDLEPDAIAEGQRRIAALGLSNIKLETADILDVAQRTEEFDYLICHGVLSWVPKKVRNAIFRICKTQLSPRGLAMLSFNVLPGWRLEYIIRDICRGAEDPALDPQTNVARAIERLQAVAAGTPDNTPYSFLVRQAAQKLAGANPTYFLGEYLAPVNKPFRFADVLRSAGKAGMHYVSEPEVSASSPERLVPDAAKARALANGDAAQLQSILDEMSGRSFRRAIFSKAPARSEPDPKALAQLHVSAALRREAPGSRIFNTGAGAYTAPNDEVADALADLASVYPATRSVAALAATDRSALENALMLLATSGLLRLQTTPLNIGRASAPKAAAFEVASLEAADQNGWFTTLQHHAVVPSNDAKALLPYLNGSRDRAALADLLQGSDRSARVEAALSQLEQAALLRP